jgi:hypothetical protein
MIYTNHIAQAEKRAEVNTKIAERIKRKKPANLDQTFQDLHDQAFENIDCLKCANCCKTTSPIFYMKDIERAAKAVKLKPIEFIDKYLKIDEDKDYILKSAPCPFLDYENYCTIYKDRPTACREYPHTNRKRMIQIMDLTLKNTLVCPAVAQIFTHLNF